LSLCDERITLRELLTLHGCEATGQAVEVEFISTVEGINKTVSLLGVRLKPRAVDGEKSKCCGESRSLIAVSERMILREALPEGSGLFD
jgi:hypothetical protein